MSGRFRTIVADPPWPLETINAGYVSGTLPRSLPFAYSTLPLADIEAIPVSDLAEKSAHLYLWTVAPFLRHSFGIAEVWGFKPKQILVWAKPGLGPGVRFRQTCEYVLFATRGPGLPVTRHDVGTWFSWPRGAHSQKPEAFLDLVESVSPGPYLEMFARRARFGWDYWGDESLGTVEMPLYQRTEAQLRAGVNEFTEDDPPPYTTAEADAIRASNSHEGERG